MSRLVLTALLVALIAVGCSSSQPVEGVDPPEPITSEEMQTLLSESSEPVVLNVWASWCTPCRSEAPLIGRAASEFEDEVRFIGLDVRDTPNGAAAFIAEFFPDAPIEHYADSSGAIPTDLGGSRGVPITFFFRPGGELSYLHHGVIDERALVLQIDELVNG
ncbi:MAG: TlpA disulfide reductase family protein [Actinomycetota bacterium]|nr:TlpA disulfide reductase family protein [Actinomycetota bacterium]